MQTVASAETGRSIQSHVVAYAKELGCDLHEPQNVRAVAAGVVVASTAVSCGPARCR
ncbi:MAG: hypothetical protein ACLSAP_07495 [Oscillospiraceae bacterium]